MPHQDLLSSQGLRLDGRRANELRRVKCKLGVFSQPDGSAYLEQGNTKVLAAVYGPHQASKSKMSTESVVVNCQYSMATFSTGERKNRPRGDRKSEEISLQLKQTLTAAIKTELYPRSQIDIYVEVLQADGGAYCVCVNAATLALIDAGIPLLSYVCACSASIAWRRDKPECLLDMGHVEESSGSPSVTVATLPATGTIALLGLSKRLHIDYMESVLEGALKGCKDIEVVLDEAVREYLAENWIKKDTGLVQYL